MDNLDSLNLSFLTTALSRRAGEGFPALERYRTTYFPTEWGFRSLVYNGDELVGRAEYGQLRKLEDLPFDLTAIVRENEEIGIYTYLGGITVGKSYERKGVGTALWGLALKKIAKSRNQPFNELVQDESGTNWAEKHISEVKELMLNLGFESKELWQGSVDKQNAHLVQYLPKMSV